MHPPGANESHLSPFFLPSCHGGLYALHLPPAKSTPLRGAVLWLQPFAEEANCARRHMVAAARECQAEGYASLLLDLFGTGESDGELLEATWSIWQENILDAARWLRQAYSAPLWLCGLRAGALFAANVAADLSPVGLLCWQPALSGKAVLDNFLRMKLASEWSQAEAVPAAKILGDLRTKLEAGEPVEVGGYELSARLAADLSGLSLGWSAAVCGLAAIHEFRSRSDDAQPLTHTPAIARLCEELRSQEIRLATEVIAAPAFWQSHEVPVTYGLGTTAAALMQRLHHG